MTIVTHLDRPSLDYWHAFDFCAAKAWHRHQPITLLSSSRFYYQQLTDRLYDRDLIHVDTTAWSRQNQHEQTLNNLADWKPQDGVWIWAEPAQGTLKTVLQQYVRLSQSSETPLIIISSGLLAKRLPEWQKNPYPVIGEAGAAGISQALSDANLAVKDLVGFHGPLSVVLGYMGLGLKLFKQPALGDRVLYAMRKHYTVGKWQAPFAPVQVRIVGGKPKIED